MARHPQPGTDAVLSAGETGAAALAATAFTGVGVVWSAANTTNWATGGGPGGAVRFGDAAAAIAAAAANPTGLPAGLNITEPGLFWASLAAHLTVLIGAAVGVGRWRNTRPSATASVEDAATGWATRKQIRNLLIRRPHGRRLTIGTFDRRHLLATEHRHSLIVFGPTQSGKTTGLVIPAIANWDGPVVATSTKTDIITATQHARQARGGALWIFDPATPNNTNPHVGTWSPLHAIETVTKHDADSTHSWRLRQWTTARESARGLTNSARANNTHHGEDFWYTTAEKLLAPLLYAAAIRGETIARVVTWIDTQEQTAVRETLETTHIQQAINAWDATQSHEERIRSGAYTTLEHIMYAYADPTVTTNSATTTINPTQLLDGQPNTLYIVSPIHQQQRLQPVFAALISNIVHHAYQTAHTNACGRLDPPLLLVLDEAANIAPIPDLDQLAATGAGAGIQLLTILQDLAQLEHTYGPRRAASITNNHPARLLLPGTADPTTLNYFTTIAGEQTLTTHNTTHTQTHTSHSTNQQLRPLTPPATLRTQAAHHATCIYNNHPPIQTRLQTPQKPPPNSPAPHPDKPAPRQPQPSPTTKEPNNPVDHTNTGHRAHRDRWIAALTPTNTPNQEAAP